MKKEYYEQLKAARVIPVIQLDRKEDALPLAETMITNGMNIAEVTLRSDAALDAMEAMAKAFPEMLMIAGTVLNPAQVDQAINAGANMVVSPGFNPTTVAYCVDKKIDIIPGVMTPGEMEQAMMHGLRMVKFFPAEASGGVNFLKAISAPYRNLEFMPTGGINPNNVSEYLALPQVVCCGGSWMVKPELVKSQNWDEIGRLIREVSL